MKFTVFANEKHKCMQSPINFVCEVCFLTLIVILYFKNKEYWYKSCPKVVNIITSTCIPSQDTARGLLFSIFMYNELACGGGSGLLALLEFIDL